MLLSVHSPHQARAFPLLNERPAVYVDERKADSALVALPSTSVHLVARFGRHVSGGFDVHVMGPRHKVHRKLIRGGQRTVIVRLSLGTYRAVIGRPASELAGRIVALGDLWGAAAHGLEQRLAAAKDADAAVAALKEAVAKRLERGARLDANTRLAHRAARRLETCNVASVAEDLGVSERHLRRVFQEVVGLSPKTYAKLIRFERALDAGKDDRYSSWSDIAVSTGYYDQAHLIADFRSIAGATPLELLAEVSGQS